MDLRPFEDFKCSPAESVKTTNVKTEAYYTVTENVQWLSDGKSQDQTIKSWWGNTNTVFPRLLNTLQEGDRFLMFSVFFLWSSPIMDAILAGLKRGVTMISIMTVETEFKGPGSIGMGNAFQTAQRQSFLDAGGIIVPIHFISFSNVGQTFPWTIDVPEWFGDIVHAKMYIWHRKSYPALYVGSQNPEFDDEDIGITIENCPELAEEGIAIMNRFIYAGLLQQASELRPWRNTFQESWKKALFDDSGSDGKSRFVGYSNYRFMNYLPGNQWSSQVPPNARSWRGISENLPSILEVTGVMGNLRNDTNLHSLNMTPGLVQKLEPFRCRNLYNEYNRLGMQVADWSGYQNYQCKQYDISFLWNTDSLITQSSFYGSSCRGKFYLAVGPPNFCAADANSTYDLVALAKTINCAKTNVDIANMDPNFQNFDILREWIVAAVKRGVHVRVLMSAAGCGPRKPNDGPCTDEEAEALGRSRLFDGHKALLRLQNEVNEMSGCRQDSSGSVGTFALRVWDAFQMYSNFKKQTGTSAYHCKYILNETRIYIGNQNLSSAFYEGMGGVSIVIEDCDSLRDQFQNYFNRDWESPFVWDLGERWGICGGEKSAENIDECFAYGPLQTRPELMKDSSIPQKCKDRIKPWLSRSFFRTSDGSYLGSCTGPQSITGCCLPSDLVSLTNSNCLLGSGDSLANPPYTVSRTWDRCKALAVTDKRVSSSSKPEICKYRIVISIPPSQYGHEMDSIFPTTAMNRFNPPDGNPTKAEDFTDTYSAWIAATNRAQKHIDCVFIYSTLMGSRGTITKGTSAQWFQSLMKAADRGVVIRLIFTYPPNANWDESYREITTLKGNRSNVHLYWTNYFPARGSYFVGSDQTSLDFIEPWHGPSTGILHTKLYVWDGNAAYVGAQNQEFPIAIESGLMLYDNASLVNDLQKVVDFYVLSACLQCRGEGITALEALKDAGKLAKYQSWYNMHEPLSVELMDDSTRQYHGHESNCHVYISATPLATARAMSRTFDLDAIRDVTKRAQTDILLATMDISNATDFYQSTKYEFNKQVRTPLTAKFPALFQMFRDAAARGVNVKVLVGLRRSFGSTAAEPCGYSPSNVSDLMHLQNDINKNTPGSMHTKWVRFDCRGGNKDYCYGIFHSKTIITDQSILVDTSNFTGDYFLSTGGICFVAHRAKSKTKELLPLQNEYLNFYRRFWHNKDVSIDIEDIVCTCEPSIRSQFSCDSEGKVPTLKPGTLAMTGCLGTGNVMKSNGECYPKVKRPPPAPAPPYTPPHIREQKQKLEKFDLGENEELVFLIVVALVILGAFVLWKRFGQR